MIAVEYKSENNYDSKEGDQIPAVDMSKVWGYRHQQCLILFLCVTTAYSMRSCMGVSLVAMTVQASNTSDVGRHNISHTNNGSAEVTDNMNNATEEIKIKGWLDSLMLRGPYPRFMWNKKVQDTIISSFFWGYMLLQIPAGQLAHRFGAKYLIVATMFINSILSISLPWAALYGGWMVTVLLRFVQGLSQACIMPSTHTFFGKWATLQERGRLTALVYGGQALGTVLGLPISGYMASSPLGWPGIFRFYGLLSGIVGACWLYFGADTPACHPKISLVERNYIESGLGQRNLNHKKQVPIPWRHIMTSRGVWAIVVAHIGQTWCQVILYSEVPAYMANVMKVNIKANGLLSALPFMVMFIMNFVFSWMTDYMINKQILSVTNTRKFANTIGCWPASLGFIILAYAPQNIYVVEALLIVICGLKVAAHVGFQINHIDIAPNFAGTLMGITNFASNCVGSFAPMLAGYILTEDVANEYLWRKVFCIAAGLYFMCNLVYIIFGTAERAPWNKISTEKEDGKDDKMEYLDLISK